MIIILCSVMNTACLDAILTCFLQDCFAQTLLYILVCYKWESSLVTMVLNVELYREESE